MGFGEFQPVEENRKGDSPGHPRTIPLKWEASIFRSGNTWNPYTQATLCDLELSSRLLLYPIADYYNHRRYHKALGDVTPSDVLYGRREQILQRRKEVRIQTINRRRNYNQGLRELANAA